MCEGDIHAEFCCDAQTAPPKKLLDREGKPDETMEIHRASRELAGLCRTT